VTYPTVIPGTPQKSYKNFTRIPCNTLPQKTDKSMGAIHQLQISGHTQAEIRGMNPGTNKLIE